MKKLDCDEVITKYIGANGKWQTIQMVLVLIQSFAYSNCFLIYLFSAFTPEHRCHVPQCEQVRAIIGACREHFLLNIA